MKELATKDRQDRSEYSDLAREHTPNVPSLDGFGIQDLENFVDINGEYVQVDTILSFCRRTQMSESTNRQVYYEFELLEKEGVLPAPLIVANRKYYPTSFLDPIVRAIASDLYARSASRAKSGKVHDIVAQLIKQPELIDAIAELLAEAKAR